MSLLLLLLFGAKVYRQLTGGEKEKCARGAVECANLDPSSNLCVFFQLIREQLKDRYTTGPAKLKTVAFQIDWLWKNG